MSEVFQIQKKKSIQAKGTAWTNVWRHEKTWSVPTMLNSSEWEVWDDCEIKENRECTLEVNYEELKIMCSWNYDLFGRH